ncbi:hypothetical protein FRB99_004729, partial [Tulasnella sp. 403]
ARDEMLRSIVPCWDSDDEVGEGSTCPVVTEQHRSFFPSFSLRSSDIDTSVLGDVESRAQELWDRFQADKQTFGLQRAIHILDHVVAAPHIKDEQLVPFVFFRGITCGALFGETVHVPHLDKAIESFQRALNLVPRDAPGRRNILELLGPCLKMRHSTTQNLDDVDRAIEVDTEALESLPRDATRPRDLINRLGELFRERFLKKRDVSDLDKAIFHWDELLSSLRDDDPLRVEVLFDLGSALFDRCERMGNTVDVEHAIGHLKEALSLERDDTRRPTILDKLANATFIRHMESPYKVSDLDDAIHLHREALSFRSSGHRDRPTSLNNLAGALQVRYKTIGDMRDLNEAFQHVEEAVSLVNQDDP